jgi:hypothetical protein
LTSFVDASFLFSLYGPDANSPLAASKMQRADLPLLLTDLGVIEVANAVALRLFRKEFQPAEAKNVLDLFAKDMEEGVVQVAAVSASAYQLARQLAERHTPLLGTRTLDVLHVAAALALKADTFYTFDRKQAQLASAAGLRLR